MLLTAKSAAPSAAFGALRRPAFERAANGSLTLITTPPGYLLADSLMAVLAGQGRPVVWLRAGKEDRDPASFLLSLISGAQRIHPGTGAATLEEMKRRPGPVSGWPRLFTYLARELGESLPPSSVLVLEHIHLLRDLQPTLSLIAGSFLPELRPRMACILTAHEPVPPAIFPLDTAQIKTADLRVDARAGLSLAQEAGVDLPSDCIRRAVSLIEGRLVALAGLFAATGALGPGFIQEAVGRSRSAGELLRQIASTSLATSGAGSIQAVALAMQMEYSHPALFKAAFDQDELPMGPWQQSLMDGWIRLRSMWQTPLKNLFRRESESLYTALHLAADQLVFQGANEQGVELYLKLGDYASAAQTIATDLNQMMSYGQWETLQSWLGQMPPDMLHDWPDFVYCSGEILAASGRTKEARRSFSLAAALYTNRDENEGACQSLLAESAVAAWDNELGHARASAAAAATLAEAAGDQKQQAFAAWQLGLLAAGSGELDIALAHFNRAVEKVRDPFLTGIFKEVEETALRQLELSRQRKLQHQAYQDAIQAEEAGSQSLESLIHTPPANLPALLSTQGWSKTPLMLKLSSPILPVAAPLDPGRPGIWQGLLKGMQHVMSLSQRPHLARGKTAMDGTLRDAGPTARSLLAVDPARTYPAQARPSAELPEPAKRSGAKIPALAASTQPPPADMEADTRAPAEPSQTAQGTLTLTAHLFGAFRIYVNDLPIEDWPGSRGQSILKYMLYNERQKFPRDVLMDTFWPEASPEAARNNLNVALHNLRKALRSRTSQPVIVYREGVYRFNPEAKIWVDVKEFEHHLQAGRQLEASGQLAAAIGRFEIAASLYQGDFLAGDLYEDWPVLNRERLRIAYLDLLDRLSHIYFSQGQYTACTALCQLILERDNCREDAYRLLMRCYSRQGQPHLALRQYQICVEALQSELELEPEAATDQLYQQIRRRGRV